MPTATPRGLRYGSFFSVVCAAYVPLQRIQNAGLIARRGYRAAVKD
jgi:hypothetical protein